MKAAVIGGGIVGSILSLGLVDRDWHVDVFDAGTGEDNCSYAGAGMLAPIGELIHAETRITELGFKSIERWPKILSQLNSPVFFSCEGSIVTASAKDKAELDHAIKTIQRKCAQADIRRLDRQALVDLEPELDFNDAYYFPGEGQIDVQALLPALKSTLIEKGVSWKQETVTDIKSKKQHYDWVFDCRGMAAKEDIKDLRAVRGELIWLHAPEVTLHRPIRLFHPRYNLYVAPRPDHRYLIGSTEIESEDYSPISVRSVLEFLSAAYSLHSGFSEARILKTVTQCRPTMPDHLPYVDISPGFVRINGLYRHGYLITPALIDEVLEGIS